MTLSLLALVTLAAPAPRLIVQLAPGVSPETVARRNKITLIDVTPNAPFALFEAKGGRADAVQLRLLADPGVVWAEDNAELGTPEGTKSKGTTVSVIGERAGVVQKNAGALAQVRWSAGLAATEGRPVRLAVLDNGLSRKQTAVWAKVDAAFDAFGGNADDKATGLDTNRNGVKDEGVGHGTMVAGIVDAVAPKVRLVIAKVADSDGYTTSWNLVKGLVFAVTSGAEVANVSLGSAEATAAFNDVAEWAQAKGLLVVSAAGNTATDRAWYPARSSKALCVTALNADDSKASFGNWDSAVDACAPGVGIVSLGVDGGLVAWSGTSFAAPFVAAGLADCLRRTTPQTPGSLINVVNGAGRSVDSVNKKYKGKIGTALDIAALDRRLRPRP